MLFRNPEEIAEHETPRFCTGLLGAVVNIAIWFVYFGSFAGLENPMFEQCLMVQGWSLGITVRELGQKIAETEFPRWRLDNLSSLFYVRATNVALCVTSRRMRWVIVECGRLQWFLQTMTTIVRYLL